MEERIDKPSLIIDRPTKAVADPRGGGGQGGQDPP